MACRVLAVAFHVHGHEADLDQFFQHVEDKLTEVTNDAEQLWPGLEFLPVDDPFEGGAADE